LHPEFAEIGKRKIAFMISEGKQNNQDQWDQHKKGKKEKIRYGPVPSPSNK
jgi:hypothetical protein